MNPRIVKIARNIMFMLSVPIIVSAFVFADVSTKNEICNGIQISFSNNQLSFVTKDNVLALLRAKGITVNKTKLRNINVYELENTLEANKWVSNADIFVAANNKLHIHIVQKNPVVRVQPDNDYEEPYYLDDYGNTIAYSTQYIPYLPVATAPEIGFSANDRALKTDLVKLAKYLQQDTFWSAAISQIVVSENKSIALIPAIGHQQILLGNIDQLDNKMSKLLQFYRQGYHTVNWDQYDEIDLRFERQVVCRNTRGQRLSVDPYDKTTHKEVLAKTTAPAGTTAIASNVTNVKPLPIAVNNNSTTTPKVVAKTSLPKSTSEKPVLKAIVDKPIAKKETVQAKKETKEAVKPKTDNNETKPKITEVEHSKYFNNNK
jgi:cell division protein FtsQ